jgi:hypothetical protein
MHAHQVHWKIGFPPTRSATVHAALQLSCSQLAAEHRERVAQAMGL